MDVHDPPLVPPGGLVDRLERELGRRRVRLALPRLYRNGLDELHALQQLIAAEDPDWPPVVLAQLMVGSAGRARELNAGVRERTKRPGDGLDLELDWIAACHDLASRILDEGGTGTAGVREPRRPRPTPGRASAEVPIDPPAEVADLVAHPEPGWWRRRGA